MNKLLEKLTLIIPVYNDVKYIEKTIQSSLTEAAQIFIYDNCSTDGTSDICAKLAKENDHVKHIRHDENIGAFKNFRQGFFDCKTEYVMLLGSHDMLHEGYSLPLLETAEKDKAIILTVGTIQHIDEQDNNLKQVTYSNWLNMTKNDTPLDRIESMISKFKDCIYMFGIFRTELVKKAWFNKPSIGFDRVFLTRAAGIGKIAYTPDSTFYAREFPKTRNINEDQKRRTTDIVAGNAPPLAEEKLTRHRGMVDTVLEFVESYDDLSQALRIIDKINRRYQSRRHFQKLRLVKIFSVIAVILLSLVLMFFTV